MKKKLLLAFAFLLFHCLMFAQPLEELDNWAKQQTPGFDANDVVDFMKNGRADGDITFGSESIYNNGSTDDICTATLDATHFIVTYRDMSNFNYGTAIVGTVANNVITYGPEHVFYSGSTQNISVASLDATHFVIAYVDVDNSSHGTAIIGVVAGSAITYGATNVFEYRTASHTSVTALDATHFVVAYQTYQSGASRGRAIVGSVSGNTIDSYGASNIFNTAVTDYISVVTLDATHFAVAYKDGIGTAIVGTVSGNTITSYGPEEVFNSANTFYISSTALDATHFVIAYRDGGSSNRGTVIAASVDGNNITFGNANVFSSTSTDYISITLLDANHFIVTYRRYVVWQYRGCSKVGKIAGNSVLSYGSESLFNPDARETSATTIDATHFVVAYQDFSNGKRGTSLLGEVEIIEITWTGANGTDWNTSGNWDNNDVPTIVDNVVIPNVANDPEIAVNGTGNCNNLSLENGATLNIQSDATGTGSIITNGAITNNGTVNIQRYVTNGVWHLISVPISDATTNTFMGNYLQYYDGSWNDITDSTTSLTPTKGYSLWGVAKTTTYTFSGNLNTGNQSISITSANDGWNLLGNPYPSPIDWSDLDDTYGAVYYWDPGTSNYVSWNNGVGGGSQYVPAMQGFWIKANSNGTYSLNNYNRTHNGNSTYYKNKETLSNYIELQVDGNGYHDRLFINLNNETTDDFDFHYDAYKLPSSEDAVPQLYSFAGNDILSIDRRPECEVIQLGFQCGESGNYSINLNELSDISSVVLEDIKTGTMRDLQTGNYDFEYSIADDELRFKLHLQTTGTSELGKESFSVYADNKTIYVKSSNTINGTVTILNILGQTMLEQKVNNSTFVKMSTNCTIGIHIVVIENGSTINSNKVFVK